MSHFVIFICGTTFLFRLEWSHLWRNVQTNSKTHT